jgi:hypothetical protein
MKERLPSANEALFQSIMWEGKEYRTTHCLHRDYLANSANQGKYMRHDNFLRMLKRMEAVQLYITQGDFIVLQSWEHALKVTSNLEETLQNKALRDAFRAVSNHPLSLVRATIQVALWHHLDDETSKQLSVTANTATAYWVSTPTFTVLIAVNRGGLVTRCAPYARKWALHVPWPTVYHSLCQRYGAGLRMERLVG